MAMPAPIRKFNLNLAELSENANVSIIGLGTIARRYDGDTLALAMHPAPEGESFMARISAWGRAGFE